MSATPLVTLDQVKARQRRARALSRLGARTDFRQRPVEHAQAPGWLHGNWDMTLAARRDTVYLDLRSDEERVFVTAAALQFGALHFIHIALDDPSQLPETLCDLAFGRQRVVVSGSQPRPVLEQVRRALVRAPVEWLECTVDLPAVEAEHGVERDGALGRLGLGELIAISRRHRSESDPRDASRVRDLVVEAARLDMMTMILGVETS